MHRRKYRYGFGSMIVSSSHQKENLMNTKDSSSEEIDRGTNISDEGHPPPQLQEIPADASHIAVATSIGR